MAGVAARKCAASVRLQRPPCGGPRPAAPATQQGQARLPRYVFLAIMSGGGLGHFYAALPRFTPDGRTLSAPRKTPADTPAPGPAQLRAVHGRPHGTRHCPPCRGVPMASPTVSVRGNSVTTAPKRGRGGLYQWPSASRPRHLRHLADRYELLTLGRFAASLTDFLSLDVPRPSPPPDVLSYRLIFDMVVFWWCCGGVVPTYNA